MNALPILAIALISCQFVSGQTQLTDDMIKRLGGDPVALREQEMKRQKEAPSSLETALQERVASLAESITDETMASLSSSDPLLSALYVHGMGWTNASPKPIAWVEVINRDMQRRKDAPQLVEAFFREKKKPSIRYTVMEWLDKHRDVKWADEIMNEAIKLYRADPREWDYSGVAMLRRLVAGRGNESHLPFFDELDKTEFGSGDDRDRLKLRIERDKEWAAYFGLPANVSVSDLAKYVRFDPSPRGNVPTYVGSGPLPPGNPPSPFGQPMLPKAAAQKIPSASIQPTATNTVEPAAQPPKPTQPTPLGQQQEQREENKAPSIEWLAGSVVVIAAIGLLWLVLKKRQ